MDRVALDHGVDLWTLDDRSVVEQVPGEDRDLLATPCQAQAHIDHAIAGVGIVRVGLQIGTLGMSSVGIVADAGKKHIVPHPGRIGRAGGEGQAGRLDQMLPRGDILRVVGRGDHRFVGAGSDVEAETPADASRRLDSTTMDNCVTKVVGEIFTSCGQVDLLLDIAPIRIVSR